MTLHRHGLTRYVMGGISSERQEEVTEMETYIENRKDGAV
jgi:hypothetical protein